MMSIFSIEIPFIVFEAEKSEKRLMAFLRLLRFNTVQHTWERNGFTDVFSTSCEGYHTLNPNTKSTVWDCTRIYEGQGRIHTL